MAPSSGMVPVSDASEAASMRPSTIQFQHVTTGQMLLLLQHPTLRISSRCAEGLAIIRLKTATLPPSSRDTGHTTKALHPQALAAELFDSEARMIRFESLAAKRGTKERWTQLALRGILR